MSAPADAVAPGRWRRFWIIFGVFVAVAPAGIGALGLIALRAVGILSVAFDAPLAVFGLCALLGLPIAVMAGILFGTLAVHRGYARLWTALVPAALMPPIVNAIAGFRMFPIDWSLVGPVLVLTALPLLLAWALSRPWHR